MWTSLSCIVAENVKQIPLHTMSGKNSLNVAELLNCTNKPLFKAPGLPRLNGFKGVICTFLWSSWVCWDLKSRGRAQTNEILCTNKLNTLYMKTCLSQLNNRRKTSAKEICLLGLYRSTKCQTITTITPTGVTINCGIPDGSQWVEGLVGTRSRDGASWENLFCSRSIQPPSAKWKTGGFEVSLHRPTALCSFLHLQ